MRRLTSILAIALLFVEFAHGQEGKTSDSTRVLDEIVIKAYRANRPLREVPVSVGVVDSLQMDRFGPASIVSAVNTVPGVRMEERSPGSYRFSIRGSLLRSPFGIRNVKFYWRGLPITDAGGNTYLNLLDFTNIGRMEIVKGPGASLYGASTGGVVLLDGPQNRKQSSFASISAGSYGLFRYYLQSKTSIEKSDFDVSFSSQSSNGYRQNTAMERRNVNVTWDYHIDPKSTLSVSLLSAQLYYQTPGGLNMNQFNQDPRQARPATATLPGAIQQQASIKNNSVWLGTSYVRDWNYRRSTFVGAYGMYTDFKNPAILNYEKRNERNWGARTENQYVFDLNGRSGRLTLGGEYQGMYSPVSVYDNNGGAQGNLRTSDKLWSSSGLAFAQVEFELPYEFLVTAGASANFLNYRYDRVSVSPVVEQERKFDPALYPRLAVLKKINQSVSVFATLGEGFSAPTLAEVRPSTGNFNNGLNPEIGRNLEMGIRTQLLDGRLKFDVAAYDFKLRETIVVQTRTSDGADYFQNAGTTSQKGIEANGSWTFVTNKFIKQGKLWASYTYNHYRFLNYVTNGNDLSGYRLTGVPPVIVVSGLDLEMKGGFYLRATINFTDHIPLNDQSSEFASKYTLVGSRIGKVQHIWKLMLDVFAGVDNALDQTYSLGNDLNAAGGRYYNPAAGRNYYLGLNIPLVPTRQ